MRSLATGTLLLLYMRLLIRPPLVTAVMLIAGLLIGLVGLAKGKVERYRRTAHSWEAWAYLTVFGSCIGYGAYYWLAYNITLGMLGNYVYVNPSVAVLLGCWLSGESLSRLQIAAPGVILVGRVLVALPQRPLRPAAATAEQ